MAFTAGLTSGLTEPITKTLLDDYFYGGLTLEELVALLGSTLWLDATETYAKSKVAVNLVASDPDYFSSSASELDLNTGAFSMAAWIKMDSSARARICGNSNGTNSQFLFTTNSTGKLALYITDGDFNTRIAQESTATLSAVTWYHVAATFDGGVSSSGITLYINGDPVTSASNDALTYAARDSIQGFTLGRFTGDTVVGAGTFDGQIDQFKVFNKALSAPEVSTLYNSGDGLIEKDLDGTETFYNNIVAWYDFNTPPNFGRNYAEESHAVSLDGTNDSISYNNYIGTSLYKNIGDDFSFGGWFNPSNAASLDDFISTYNSYLGVYFGYFLRVDTGVVKIRFHEYGGSNLSINLTSTTTLSDNTWYHLVVTHDGTTDGSGIKLYINGALETFASSSLNTLTGDLYSGQSIADNFGIGWSVIGTRFAGKVDEVFFYSDELTSGEVSTLYNGGTVAPARTLHTDNLVSDWSFNAQNVTDIGKDSYGSNDLTPTSIVEADLVGGKDSLDLTEVNITSANAVLGHIEGKAAGYDGVTKWLDRSGNGNDVSQSTLADCPYFDAATNSIIFTGTQNLVTSGNIGLTGDFTIFEVKAYSDVTEVVDTVGINGNLIRNIGSGSERNVWSATPNNNSTNLVDNTFAITAQNLEDGVSGNFWTNGVKDDAFSDTTMVRTDGPLKINQDTGIVGELRYKAVLYWNRKLTDSEMATVFEYLNDLYGVY